MQLSKLFICGLLNYQVSDVMNPLLLKGKKVVGTEGYILGEFSDLHVEFDNWQATGFHVILADDAVAELKLQKPFLRKVIVCLPTQLIGAVGDVITLKVPVRSLADIAEKEMQVNTLKVEGKKVVSSKGYSMGQVEALDVEPTNWHVTGLQVSLTDESATELGFKRPFVSKVVVIVPSDVVGSVGNFVSLKTAVENLKSLVECIKSCQQA